MTGPEVRSPHQPAFNLPPMTKWLLAVNVGVYLLRLILPAGLDDSLVFDLGFVPLRYHAGEWLSWPAVVSPITYQFLHASLLHLGVNMLALVAFGAGVEQRVSGGRFLVFYLLCGIAGAAAQFVVAPNADDLLIGASAAISGLFGAILRFRVARQGIWLIVVIWLVTDVVTGVSGVGSAEPVAWVAHLGGFATGLILFPLFDRRLV
jgi:membrane associated rhomboid family serine protease